MRNEDGLVTRSAENERLPTPNPKGLNMQKLRPGAVVVPADDLAHRPMVVEQVGKDVQGFQWITAFWIDDERVEHCWSQPVDRAVVLRR